ncbi:ATP-dependent endonuclease [Dyadobacter sp. Leaf189]|uniref:ATP-dependent nuclease n=1 Tax=Dyadobacter sp. Leaf189 TaxID=1736295 RepID=UPI0006FCBC00|nr:AAA family ATPase [Dyadobacter sp. Leaf189]KQS26586.1 ATP-dependent endonuclease [Dyadobacter sp. Leaf189]
MQITKLIIKGFRSFGPTGAEILINQTLAAFIGLNSSGKTSAIESLRKLFGSSSSEREILHHDFHSSKNEQPGEVSNKQLSIEVRVDFFEKGDDAVPHFFQHMVVEEEGGKPYLRIRLEASWEQSDREPDGIIDSNLFLITSAGHLNEEKQLYPNHLRSLFQIIYVPAIRRPTEQLRYASGTMLYRILKKIKWSNDFKVDFATKISEINNEFKGLREFTTIQASISSFWKKFHKDSRYAESTLGFEAGDLDSILKKLEISFTPSPVHRKFRIDDLGEGYRSLFYLTLVCSLLDVEEKLAKDEGSETGNAPLLTILAIEEPENHIAPQLLGRVVKILTTISEKDNSQVFLSSHTPAIVKRIEPESIYHFRVTKEYETQVNTIKLPAERVEAYKYVKEAIRNYPEIYFAKIVVIGEGDTEGVIFNRLMDLFDTDFDDNIITFAPLGHRFVNHIWTMLKALHIPYITLLDLDVGREGGGWGRIKYSLEQLMNVGVDKNELFELEGGEIMSDPTFDSWSSKKVNDEADLKLLVSWVDYLEDFDIYYSGNLDLDFLMLSYYPAIYKTIIPAGGGPRIPDKVAELDKFNAKVKTAVQATLKSENSDGSIYSDAEKELMIWYNYHFLGRSKPGTHIEALAAMSDDVLKKGIPPLLVRIFDRISEIILSEVEK